MWPFSRKAEPAAEQRDSGWLNFSDFEMQATTSAGTVVTQTNAVTLPAVWRCITLNSETIASLPVDCLVKNGDARVPYANAPAWLRNPNDEQTWEEFIQQFQASIEVDGNGYALKVSSGNRLTALYLLDPSRVTVGRLNGQTGPIVYTVQHLSGESSVYPANAVLHVRGFTLPGQLKGLSPIATHALTIGRGMAASEFGARWFGSGAHLSGVIESPTNMTPEQAQRLQEMFSKKHGGISKSHAIGVLSAGMTFKALSVSAEESQFLDTIRATASEVAYIYGTPAEYVTDMGTSGAKGYVTALAQRNRLWLQTGLLMRIRRLEVAFSALLPEPAYIKWNVDALLRADPAERASLCAAMIQNRAMTPNEWRALEDMNPLPGGDDPLESVQFQEEPAPAEDEPEPAGEPDDQEEPDE